MSPIYQRKHILWDESVLQFAENCYGIRELEC